ncbi:MULTISPECIES: C2H2-type zinc finger protein [Metallosphaera]|uniref:C2H2-type zinc finger protein n=1 Tax=Bacteria TaxID=2 RepID=UPI002989CB45|nr:C2H2-type zinc finger protein [Metallosphaera sedula]MCP6729959.1 hypothetical protein [Metallosphaera sedula]MCP6729966.1 hypothetical protein [Metallosphaera sedula]
MSKSNHKSITIHVDSDELTIYHSLSDEQKRILRLVLKSMIRNPELLSSANYYVKLALKSVSEYICPLCFIPFSSRKALILHVRYTSHEPVCPICAKKFNKVDAALDHICKKHNICVS